MATIKEKIKWELFKIKREAMYQYGLKHNKVFVYDEEIISKLRNYYFGSFPVSLLLLLEKGVAGFCYDRSPFIVYGFLDDDFEYVSGDADSMKLNPEFIDQHNKGVLGDLYGEHAIVVRKVDENLELVYDVTLGLIFEKDFYYKLENFKPRVVRGKKETIERANLECHDGSDFDREKSSLLTLLPMFEGASAVQDFYSDYLVNEIRILKEKSGYDNMVKEMHEKKKRRISPIKNGN